jgi:RHS repeat-associated protein
MGTQQRGTDPAAGLTLMGARLYNSVTGQFTSTDPVTGGNTTRYAYPTSPTTTADASGMFSVRAGKHRYWWGMTVKVRVYFSSRETRWIYRHAWALSAVAAAVGAVLGALVTKNPVGGAIVAAIAYIYANYILDVATNAVSDNRRLMLVYSWRGMPWVWQIGWLYAREY